MARFSFDAISSFSNVPLQLATLLGFVFSVAAFLGLPLVVLARVAGVYVPGVSSVMFALLFLGGIQLITVGIIGEYIGRIYDEVKQRPLYLVAGRLNFEEEQATGEGEGPRFARSKGELPGADRGRRSSKGGPAPLRTPHR